MAQILGFRIKNYKVLKDITLGKLCNAQNEKELTPFTAVIGKNGCGKSSILDAFGFISDCLKNGVEEACEHRGGFRKLISKGEDLNSSIDFEIYYKETHNSRPITYEFAVSLDENMRPLVLRERLKQRRKGQTHGWPFSFLILNKGIGVVWKGETNGKQESGNSLESSQLRQLIEDIEQGKQLEETNETEVVRLTDNRHLAITIFGSLKDHPRISAFRSFIESWYLSYFSPDSARSMPLAGSQKHLDIHGDNLANVVQFMEREFPKRFKDVLSKIASKIPGIEKIDTSITQDGRLLLRFFAKGFSSPFFAQQMSDGTLKLFSYLLLMEDPDPHAFICIEEPENGLYHKLLEILAMEFRAHSDGRNGNMQIFVTTHQPFFVNALKPEEVWILEKQADGFSTVTRASDIEIVSNLVSEGIDLGSLWYSDYLDGGLK